MASSSFLCTNQDGNQIAAVVRPDAEQTTLPLCKVFYSDCFEALDFLRNEADELSSESIIADNLASKVHQGSAHLSINTLEECIRGRLSESETKLLEAHILDCSFCALRAHETRLCFALFKIVLDETPNA